MSDDDKPHDCEDCDDEAGVYAGPDGVSLFVRAGVMTPSEAAHLAQALAAAAQASAHLKAAREANPPPPTCLHCGDPVGRGDEAVASRAGVAHPDCAARWVRVNGGGRCGRRGS